MLLTSNEKMKITIDYGSNWNKAWENHAKQWDSEDKDMVDHRQDNDKFAACLYSDDGTWPLSSENFYGDWTALSDSSILGLFGDVHHTDSVQLSFWPCSIIESNDEATSTVQIFQSRWHPTTKWQNLNIPRILLHVPNSHIKRFYKPYSSDLHSSKAFRHFIEIPDRIFPDKWRDNRNRKLHKIGDRIEANFKSEGKWFSGMIKYINANGNYDVSYDDGDVESGVNSSSVRCIQRKVVETSQFHPMFG